MNIDDNVPFDPREAMRVLDDQHARTAKELAYPDRLMYLVWGLVYTLGYLPLALSRGADPLVAMPLWVALGSFFAALSAGILTSVLLSIRQSRGMRGDSTRRGMLYGLAWWFSFLGVAGLGRRLGELAIDGDQVGVIINGASMMVVAAMFMAGGVIWLDVTQFVVGVCISLTTVVALFLGLPAYYWIMAFGAGGLFLVAALFHDRLAGRLSLRGGGDRS